MSFFSQMLNDDSFVYKKIFLRKERKRERKQTDKERKWRQTGLDNCPEKSGHEDWSEVYREMKAQGKFVCF